MEERGKGKGDEEGRRGMEEREKGKGDEEGRRGLEEREKVEVVWVRKRDREGGISRDSNSSFLRRPASIRLPK